MAQAWKTVRVFISSTFRDMHAERDHLVRFVFPELRERCARRRLHLVDVDLRWGITEKEAKRGKVIEVCLDEVERCRPFFVGILGERFGWVPPRYDVPDQQQYKWVEGLQPGYSITALEIYQGVLRNTTMAAHAFFYFRDPAFIAKVPARIQPVFRPESQESARKLIELKDEIRRRCPVFENYPCAYGGIGADGGVILKGLEQFGQRVLEDLWEAIKAEHADAAVPTDTLTAERAYHEAFIEQRTQRFVGRRDVLDRMTAFAQGQHGQPLVVTGAPGSGKSTLLAAFAREHAQGARSETFVLPHFIGASPGSTDIRRTLLQLCRELASRYQIGDEIPGDYEALVATFSKFLQEAAQHGRTLILIDSLNQLDQSYGAHSLNWLPQTLPPNLMLIVSTLAGDCLEALRSRTPAPQELAVGPLSSEEQVELTQQTLWDYRKRLDDQPGNRQMAMLLGKRESHIPLYLVVACEELRVFGEFERIDERLAALPQTVAQLFEQVLQRLERDHGRDLVSHSLSLLERSRQGLLESEMLELLRRDGEVQFPPAIWARLYRSLQFYLRPPGDTGEGLLYFFHQQLADAVRRRYMVSDQASDDMHRRLASFFKHKDDGWKGSYPRALSELPYHLLHGGMLTELENLLCNINFISAKCSAEMVFDLMDDYRSALFVIDSAEMESWSRFIASQRHILARWPDLAFQQMLNQPADSLVAQSAERHLARPLLPARPTYMRLLNKDQKTPPVLVEHTLFRDESRFDSVAVTADGRYVVSVDYDREMRQRMLRVWEMASGREIAKSECDSEALAITPDGRHALMGLSGGAIGIWRLPGGPVTAEFNGHTQSVTDLVVTPDGQHVVSASYDRTLKVWEFESGRCVTTLKGHKGKVNAIAINKDGRYIFSCSEDATLRVWELKSGDCLAKFKEGITANVVAFVYDRFWGEKDGRYFVMFEEGLFLSSGGQGVRFDGNYTIRAWNLAERNYGMTIGPVPCVNILCLAAIPGSSLIAVGCGYEIVIWELKGNHRVATLQGHTSFVHGLCVTPDGERIISASDDFTIRVWNWKRALQESQPEPDEEKGINSLAMMPDGEHAISGCDDKTIKVRELATGRSVFTLKGHKGGVNAVAVTPDGKHAVTTDGYTMKVWDMERRELVVTLNGHRDIVNAIAITPDGRRAISGSGLTGKSIAKIWDLTRWRSSNPPATNVVQRFLRFIGNQFFRRISCLATIRVGRNGIFSVAISPDGKYVIFGRYDGRIQVLELATRKFLTHLEGHALKATAGHGIVKSIAVSPDGKRVASGASNGTVMVWDLSTFDRLSTLDHGAFVKSVAFTPDGQHIVSTGCDDTLKIWDPSASQPIAVFPAAGNVTSCAVAPDGRIICGDQFGRFYVLRAEGLDLL